MMPASTNGLRLLGRPMTSDGIPSTGRVERDGGVHGHDETARRKERGSGCRRRQHGDTRTTRDEIGVALRGFRRVRLDCHARVGQRCRGIQKRTEKCPGFAMLGSDEDQAVGSGACRISSLLDSFRRQSCEFGLERVQPGAARYAQGLRPIAAGLSQMSTDVVVE